MRSEARDTAQGPAADAVHIAIDAAQSPDGDIAKLEQYQSTWSRQNKRLRQEGPARGTEENIIHHLEIHGAASQWSQQERGERQSQFGAELWQRFHQLRELRGRRSTRISGLEA